MPAIVGAISIITIANSAVLNIGDVYKISPLSVSKTFAGAGSFNIGTNVKVNNKYSNVHVTDHDNIDQPVLFNT